MDAVGRQLLHLQQTPDTAAYYLRLFGEITAVDSFFRLQRALAGLESAASEMYV